MLLLVMRFEDPASLQAWSSASLLAFLAFLALLGVQRAASQAARKKRGPHHLMKRPASFGQGLSGDLSDEEAERCGPCLRKMPRGAGGLPWFVGGAAVSFIGATYEPLPNRGDPEHLGEWSPAEIRDWVESQSLRHVPAEALMHYAELFLAQGISGHSLVAGSWKAADVAKLGVPLGPAISLAERIDSLVEAARAAAADDDDDDGGGGGGGGSSSNKEEEDEGAAYDSAVVRELAHKKLHAFSQPSHGFFFWNFRAEISKRWDFLEAARLGWVPADLNNLDHKVADACVKEDNGLYACLARRGIFESTTRAGLDYCAGYDPAQVANFEALHGDELLAKADEVFEAYWSQHRTEGATCDFGGAAELQESIFRNATTIFGDDFDDDDDSDDDSDDDDAAEMEKAGPVPSSFPERGLAWGLLGHFKVRAVLAGATLAAAFFGSKRVRQVYGGGASRGAYTPVGTGV